MANRPDIGGSAALALGALLGALAFSSVGASHSTPYIASEDYDLGVKGFPSPG